MLWTGKGAHLLLQVSINIFDDELRDPFETWHPALASPQLTPAAEGQLTC